MKKIILSFLFIFLVSSCSIWTNNDISIAKKELIWKQKISLNTWNLSENKNILKKDDNIPKLSKNDILTWTEVKNSNVISKSKISNIASYKIEKLTGDQFIKLDNLDSKMKNIISWIEITWKTLWNVDKIVVTFENKTSGYPIDVYTLWQFKPWSKTFIYRAKPEFKVLDYGENDYTFEAYMWDKISKLKLIINIPEKIDSSKKDIKEADNNLDEGISYEKKIIWNWSWSVYLSFPKSPIFWDPLNVWTDMITYSNIDNLNIKRVNISSWIVNCNNMTDYLKENIWWWFYWNKCRDIIKWKWISVYVLLLKWDKYVYKKIYFDYNHWLVGDYIVKKDIKADKENISSDISKINSQLKLTNKDSTITYQNYPELKVVDKLFYEIVR